MPNWSKKDTLADIIGTKLNLEEYLGKDLYSILESGRIKSDMPFGVTSKLDLRKQNINLQKKFGNDFTFDVDINKRSPMGYRNIIGLGIKKDF